MLNLLEWSMTQSGKIEYYPVEFNINTLILDNVDLLEGATTSKEIKVNTFLYEKLIVKADKNMINTVIRNLLTNAVKYTNPDGEITVQSDLDDNEIQVSITDTGVGIEQDRLKNLFDIDIDTSTKGTQRESGTGLGLILCKEFIDKHNGSILVKSTEGKGSTFMFSLPHF